MHESKPMNSVSETTADTLRSQVLQAEATLKTARDARYAAHSAADHAYYLATQPTNAQLADLKKRFEQRACDLAIEHGQCPYTSWGSHMDPHEVDVRPEGVLLTWDINGDYAPATYLASWEDLTASEVVRAEGDAE